MEQQICMTLFQFQWSLLIACWGGMIIVGVISIFLTITFSINGRRFMAVRVSDSERINALVRAFSHYLTNNTSK
jgi:hypothetical protein